MNKEEIEALENLKHIIKYWKPNDKSDELANIEYNSIKIAVNLIDKQDKAINRLAQWVANLNSMVDKQSVIEIIYKEIENKSIKNNIR